MPRIDPITGCEVMTFGEFLNAEGARDGKTGDEVFEDIMTEMNRANQLERERLMNPAVALEILQLAALDDLEAWRSDAEYHKGEHQRFLNDYAGELATLPDWQREVHKTEAEFKESRRAIAKSQGFDKPHAEAKPPFPISVAFVDKVNSRDSFRTSSCCFVALCHCTDRQWRIAFYSQSNFHGSRIDPPDSETELEWKLIAYEFAWAIISSLQDFADGTGI